MNEKEQIGRILEFVYDTPDVPEYIGADFERWLAAHNGEPVVDEVLRSLWDRQRADEVPDGEMTDGLNRLHASLRPRLPWRRYLHRVAGIAAVLVAVFLCGYFVSEALSDSQTEVVMLTAEGSVGKFTLPDGTHVWLNGESRLKYLADFDGDFRDVDLSGEAFFEVMRDTLRPFRVRMNDLQVTVLGTSFDAIGYAAGGYEEIILKSGSVRVSDLSGAAPVTLAPNEKLRFDRYSKKICVEKVDARNYCQWFEPRLVFDNQPIRDIVINLERRFNAEISLSPRIAADTRISLTVRHESLDDIMEVMSALIPIRYRIDGSHVFVTKK